MVPSHPREPRDETNVSSENENAILSSLGDNTPSISPKDILQCTLSIRSEVQTASSFVERMNRLRLLDKTIFRCIGRGSCGTVWEVPGTETAFKTSSGTGPNAGALAVDYHLTMNAFGHFLGHQHQLESIFPGLTMPRVPRPKKIFGKESTWLAENSGKFPASDVPKAAVDIIEMQRILPLPAPTRTALIDHFFDPHVRGEAHDDPENKDCLVRLYLGSRRPPEGAQLDSLRNFQLYCDMAVELGLDVAVLARALAASLAVLHWAVNTDAMDVEWVLASAAASEVIEEFDPHVSRNLPNFKKRVTHVWVLDFDKAREVDVTDKKGCISMLLSGAAGNDPYFPRPEESGAEAYAEFKATYLKASAVVIDRLKWQIEKKAWNDLKVLPGLFIDAWEDWSAKPAGEIGFDLADWGGGDDESDGVADESEGEDRDYESDEESEEDSD